MTSELVERQSSLTRQTDSFRDQLRGSTAAQIANKSGLALHSEALLLHSSSHFPETKIPTSDFIARRSVDEQPLDPLSQAILVTYLCTADGAPEFGQWIAFSELPDGRFYATAFQGYTGQKLARCFQGDLVSWRKAAQEVDGRATGFSDAGFVFDLLPRLSIMVAVWVGDEDFATSYRLLFDANVPHYMPTDGCAILGSMLTGRLLGAGK